MNPSTPPKAGTGALPRPDRALKRYLPKTLYGRALIIIVAPMVLLQLIATYVFYERHWDHVTRRLAQGLGGDITLVIHLLREFPEPGQRAFVLAEAKRLLRLDVALAPQARLPASAPPPAFGRRHQTIATTLANSLGYPFHLDTGGLKDDIRVSVQLAEGVLHFTIPRSRVESSSTYIFIMWMVGAAVVLVAIALLFMRNQLRPILRLAEAADNMGKGREVGDFRPSGATEVRRAAAAFLRMRERIERQVRQRTEMLAGVSHDLRTPLTRMKLQLAMLGDAEEAVSLGSDVADMERMVEGYLAFARGEDTEATVATDLSGLLREVAEEARRHGREVALSIEGDLVLPARAGALKRCLTNLVDNARRHGTRTSIHARRGTDAIEIAVDDDGPGIPEGDRDAVFLPFHRLDASRNPDTGGTGLGLTIARDVARGHGGDITLGTAPAGGLRALVRLPL